MALVSRHGHLFAVALLLAGGCKVAEREPCTASDECKEGLSCVAWSDAHAEIVGDCRGERSCLDAQREDAIEQAVAEREKERRRSRRPR